MKSLSGYVALWIITLVIVGPINSLECWKCISDDCDGNPEINYKAKKVTCKEEESCMKVRYQMYDNVTKYDTTIRTCSSGKCSPVTETEFAQCISDTRMYMVSGCSLRSCCNDRNLCNSGNRLQFYMYIWLVPVLSYLNFKNKMYISLS